MNRPRYAALRDQYRTALLDDVIPFWLKHSLDREYGGYLTYLDRDGSVWGTDKMMWMQWREVWMLSTLYLEVERRSEYLDAARLGAEFLMRHGRADNGDWYFLLARDGTPLVAPYNVYSDFFAVIGLARFGVASGEERYYDTALRTLARIIERLPNPKGRYNKRLPGNPPMEEHAPHMILLATAAELHRLRPSDELARIIDREIDVLMTKFLDPARKVFFENVAPDGSHPDTPAGRELLPGHVIESMGFILREAERKVDRDLIARAADVIGWTLERGWDNEYDGLLYYLDLEGRPSEYLQWSMKLWWPHIETLDTTALAWRLTRREDLWRWFERCHDYTWSHFPDPAYGEWFGYLDRQGRPTHLLKGSKWKGCFHVPRGLLHGMQTFLALAAE